MMKRYFILAGLIAMLAIFTGCAGMKLSRVEMDYGASFKLARFNQILNPDAEKNLEPVSGLDGVVAGAAMGKYWESFEKAKCEPTYMLGIGLKK